MLTDLLPCDPPDSVRARTAGPSRPIDHQILAFLHLQVDGAPLDAITKAVDDTTHYVHARVAALIRRGLVRRNVAPGAPRRGPGASRYSLTEAKSWTSPS